MPATNNKIFCGTAGASAPIDPSGAPEKPCNIT